ncbi:hypothetical protein FVEG_15280 [Fusarium verticillioides 7600]|uniref:Uncharacterized protein n=1 Tax=Gibberella moniliformis (strain M3125 / FGSC 7600) TaxID=334819 RepID=W7M1B1_GIBM7|nr:hypothetical protein FVEG_15280 [Fusarium verticillioides 7600]EWG41360.1 hypothetical protein FVEG_15280 [Fusarium verticillioides 7600]
MPTIHSTMFSNEHGSDGKYCLCTEKPIVDGDVTSEKGFTNLRTTLVSTKRTWKK